MQAPPTHLKEQADRFSSLPQLSSVTRFLPSQVFELFGGETTTGELTRLEPRSPHLEVPWITKLDGLIEGLDELGHRAREQSVGALVPMGGEMSYRYQETLTNRWLGALRTYRGKLGTG